MSKILQISHVKIPPEIMTIKNEFEHLPSSVKKALQFLFNYILIHEAEEIARQSHSKKIILLESFYHAICAEVFNGLFFFSFI